MLNPGQLADLGYVESLASSFIYEKSENFTTLIMQWEINESTLESDTKMDELQELIRDMCKIGQNNVEGLLSFQMGFNRLDEKERHIYDETTNGPCGGIIHSSIYESVKVLDSIFVKEFEPYAKLMCYTTMTESICITGPDHIDECRKSMSRWYVPEKFLVLPSLVSSDSIKRKPTEKGNINQNKIDTSVIRAIGCFKVKQEVVDDDERWQAFSDALQSYSEVMLTEIDGVYFVDNALCRKSGEFYYTEHYRNREAFLKRAEYVALKAGDLIVNMIPWDLNFFCSPKDENFCATALDKYNPKNIRKIMNNI